MLKVLLVGTTALTLIGGTAALAQQTSPAQPGSTIAQARPQFTPEQLVARTTTRVTELKADLKLTAAQEKNWPAFESAVIDSAKQRAAHFEEIRKMRETNGTAAPQGGRGEPTAAEIAAQKKLSDALDPLYKSLDANQKQAFAAKFNVDGQGRHLWFRRGEHRDQKS